MVKPIVAVVRDANGDTYLRISGDVTVAWVHPASKNDRVFEVRRRESRASLIRFLGPRSSWRHDQDQKHKDATIKVNALLQESGLDKVYRKRIAKLFADPPKTSSALKRSSQPKHPRRRRKSISSRI